MNAMAMNCTMMEVSGMEASEEICTNATNTTSEDKVDLARSGTLAIILIFSLFGNICTIAILGKFKVHRIPDVLVIGLACTDLVAALIPIPMTLYSYVTLVQYEEGSFLCNMFATIAHFTRYSSLLIGTLVSVERYFAINRPFVYRNYATVKRFVVILILCWIVSFAYAIFPALHPGTKNNEYEGFCIYDISSHYAISVILYGGIQYMIVFICFVLVMAKLLRVYRRGKRLKVQKDRNQTSWARNRDLVTFSKPSFTSRISDLGKSLVRAAPAITEKLQLGVEAQFARMLLCVVLLFYISWTAMMVLMILAQIRGSNEGLETGVFWAIRLSVISTAINPFLYGILARQYRLAYAYVIRLVLSKCCSCCVTPPLKDVFASTRTPGYEHPLSSQYQNNSRREAMEQRRHERSRFYLESKSPRSQTSSGAPLMMSSKTKTTNFSLPDLQGTDEYLSTIPEVTFDDHSTFISTAGELSSTVIIPHQARDKHSSQPDLHHYRKSQSMEHLVTAAFLHELGPSESPHPGSHNPLAYIADTQGEKAVIGSPSPVSGDRIGELSSAEASAGLDKLHGSPVYEHQQEAEEFRVSCATPSTDLNLTPSDEGSSDCLLPLRGTVVRKAESMREESPLVRVQLHPKNLRSRSLRLESLGTSPSLTFLTTQQTCDTRSGREKAATMGNGVAGGIRRHEGKADETPATGGAMSEEMEKAFKEVDDLVRNVVLDTKRLHFSEDENAPPAQQQTSREDENSKRTTSRNRISSGNHYFNQPVLTSAQPPTQTRPTEQQMKSRRGSPPVPQDPKPVENRNSVKSVQELKTRYETASPVPPTSPVHPNSTSTTSRRLSTDNSDSGRESMVFDHELAAIAIDVDTAAL